MDKVSHLLKRVLSRRGIRGEASAAHIVYLANCWIAKKLPDIAEFARATSFRDGVLTVECTHAIAAQELAQTSEAVREYIRDSTGIPVARVMLLRSKSAAN